MTEEIIIAGFGGQGVLSMGKIMAYSGVMQDKEVCWYPSYGPEMRGGTANVTVVISDEKVSSPILNEYDTGIILNQQSLTKFESKVKAGGILIYETNGITKHPSRTDITIYPIDAGKEALKLEDSKFLNMIILGAYLKIRGFLKLEFVIEGLKKSLPARHHSLIPLNEKALLLGMDLIQI